MVERIQANHACKIKHVIAVMSAKGGVGKSVITALLAVALRQRGLQVGVLDGDFNGPTIAQMFGVKDKIAPCDNAEIVPLSSNSGIKLMAINMFTEWESRPLIWREPMLASAFKQLYYDIAWGELDYLLVDVPSGTSDVPIAVLESLPLDSVFIVTSPQRAVNIIVKKSITMVRQFKHTVTGIIENMAYFVASDGTYCELFGPGNSHMLATVSGMPILAQLPVDRNLAALCDAGLIEAYSGEAYDYLVDSVFQRLKIAG